MSSINAILERHPDLETVTEERTLWLPLHPLTFGEFLTLFNEKDDVELLDGMVRPRMAAQLEHEKLYVWLVRFLGEYNEENDLGILLGSRTAVPITLYRGRLPDLLFVRKDRLHLVGQKSVDGPPDLIIELVSPGDRPSDLMALETDYRSIGVPEFAFVDQQKGRIRLLRKQGAGAADYTETPYAAGDTVTLTALNGLAFPADWLLSEPRPTLRAALAQLAAPNPTEAG